MNAAPLPLLKCVCEMHNLRHRAVVNRLKKSRYLKTGQFGLVPDYANSATSDHFITRTEKYWIPMPGGNRKYCERTVIACTPAGQELVAKLCADLTKPDQSSECA